MRKLELPQADGVPGCALVSRSTAMQLHPARPSLSLPPLLLRSQGAWEAEAEAQVSWERCACERQEGSGTQGQSRLPRRSAQAWAPSEGAPGHRSSPGAEMARPSHPHCTQSQGLSEEVASRLTPPPDTDSFPNREPGVPPCCQLDYQACSSLVPLPKLLLDDHSKTNTPPL